MFYCRWVLLVKTVLTLVTTSLKALRNMSKAKLRIDVLFQRSGTESTPMQLPLKSPDRRQHAAENDDLKSGLRIVREEMRFKNPVLFEVLFILGASCLIRSQVNCLIQENHPTNGQLERHKKRLNDLLHCRDPSVDEDTRPAPFHTLRRLFRKQILGLIPRYLPLTGPIDQREVTSQLLIHDRLYLTPFCRG